MIITIDWFDLIGLAILALMLVTFIILYICAIIYGWHDKRKHKK